MIYFLFMVASVLTLLCFRKKRSLDARHEDKNLFYYFLKNSLEFLVPFAFVTGVYVALLVFVTVASGRASLGFLYQLEETLRSINSFYSAHIKLSVTQVIIILALLYLAGLFLISADASKKVNTVFAKSRLWIRRIYVLLVLLCSFTFFGTQPGQPATDLNVHIKTLQGRYANLRKKTRDALSREVASQLINKIQKDLPPSYHSAVSLEGKTDTERNHLRDDYAKAQNEYSIKNEAAESLSQSVTPRENSLPQANETDTNDEVFEVKISESAAGQITDSNLTSAEKEINKTAQDQPVARFEFPNQEGAKRLILEVPKIFSGKAKAALFYSLIQEYPLAGPLIDALFATADDKFKQKLEDAIDRITRSSLQNSENAQRSIDDETAAFVNQTEIKIPQAAIDRSNRINADLEANLSRIRDAKGQVDSEIARVENGRADKLIAQLHSPDEADRENAARQLSGMGEKLSREKVNQLISVMRRGGQTWRKFLYREGHCDFYEYTSLKYYAADALESMRSPYVNDEIAREASRCKGTSTTTKRITDPGWI